MTMTEAPLSWTKKMYDPIGGDEMFTVRSEDPTEFFERITALKKWLVTNGYTPTPQRQANATNGAQGVAPVCQYHGPMKPSKFGGWYCSKKLHDGSYCQSKADTPTPPGPVAQAPAPQPMPQAQGVQHAAQRTNGAPPPVAPSFDEMSDHEAWQTMSDSYYSENN